MENEHGIDPAYETALADHQIDFSKKNKWVWFVGLEQRFCKGESGIVEYHHVIGPGDGYTMAVKVAGNFGETYRLVQLVRQGKAEEL